MKQKEKLIERRWYFQN